MEVLNLFLIFIQFALCYGVDLLDYPGQLPNQIFDNFNSIIQLNYEVIQQMKEFSTHNRNDRAYLLDHIIEEGLIPQEESITGQYIQLSDVLVELNTRLISINNKINNLTPDTILRLGNHPEIQDYFNLKNKNIQMQNVVITAMNHIKNYLISIMENQRPNQEIMNQNHSEGDNFDNLNNWQEGQGPLNNHGRGGRGPGRGGRG